MRNRGFLSLAAVLVAMALVAGACSSSESEDGSPSGRQPERVMVQPDPQAPPFLAQVNITDTGFEPTVLHLPAGRYVRLVLRNHGTTEHHYVIKGLVVNELRWLLEPEVDFYDLESMSESQLAEYGLTISDLNDQSTFEDHLSHHLTPQFVPFKEESPAGIKPLGTEVHGWVHLGITDTLTFYPLNTGRFEVQCVLHDDHRGEVVVFLPDDATVVG